MSAMAFTWRNVGLLVVAAFFINCAGFLFFYSPILSGVLLGWPAYTFAAEISRILGWHDDESQ